MKTLITGTRNLATLGLLELAILSAPASAPANEVLASGTAHSLIIHGPDEVLSDYCTRDSAGRLWFTVPGGARFELITSTADPAIVNPGDGAFHPFEVAQVRAALAEVRFPLASIRADVFVLPYPRRGGLESAAGPELILLSPGVRPLSAGQQHAEFVHELGHVVQYALMPDRDTQRWRTYRNLRGILDAATYSASSAHANRPHEIFAEDFRALFGGALATYSGNIENATIPPPAQVGGLDKFLLSLSGESTIEMHVVATPNPARGVLHFSRPSTVTAPLDVFDASGRRIASIQPGAAEWVWDGHDAGGHPVVGVVFARVRGTTGRAVRVTLLP
jgi:hypothetical protein